MTTTTPTGVSYTPPTYHYNPVMYGYSSYSTSRSVYFKSLLKKESFEHIEGEVTDNAYDKIKDFEDANKSTRTITTIFKVGDDYIFGYYLKFFSKKYILRKFSRMEE